MPPKQDEHAHGHQLILAQSAIRILGIHHGGDDIIAGSAAPLCNHVPEIRRHAIGTISGLPVFVFF